MIQRIASHTRSGGPTKIKLEQYTEALRDPTSGLDVSSTCRSTETIND